ncbi:hypothetical protein GIV52_17640 [Pseudomonas syringae]|uniref:Uncharacterized protein n=1 Tax=Pseudomonas syringae TaxID=317 RepID=A0A9Q4FFA5_PSESX|nr:hypothetical protein [Pseudomonas syringae]MCF5475928.1 hypothetical protein [Pseudomonas syringae]MCF5484776.1 hypothetical protein [Pseudomonas syringae]MCF5490687.1 hypothetical protein [Pseudomonas syringae]MCF5495293.1 hypothetical protein [Pseudomonas syringae]
MTRNGFDQTGERDYVRITRIKTQLEKETVVRFRLQPIN